MRAQGSRGAARAALSHGSRAQRAAVLRRGPQVAPAAVPHKLDLGEVPSPYRLTFLVDLPEVFVVKQPFRPLLAGIGRPACSEVARLCAHLRLFVKLLQQQLVGGGESAATYHVHYDTKKKERCESSGREAPRALRSLRITLRLPASPPLSLYMYSHTLAHPLHPPS